ncbi:fumarylacetoacetate hydrolase family protein [Domibacillus sp. PGB-M46]|uniref:fumarylacetoacetate hydrolase family protein n=1 Tax=Domibacillus sp. PGB-M46 TaxID=2910255 RepID=UPI001F5A549C|nr:fumarylacetoacetate hydrolase family protein [Domibacillus sp. PGB-M46]MCI2255248.1 fumarylacetoacetate hydrolase family protein [Domibacillus sp. PGB-M46]
MKLAAIYNEGHEKAVLIEQETVYLMSHINEAAGKQWSEDLLLLLQKGELDEVRNWYQQEGRTWLQTLNGFALDAVSFAPLFRHPEKVFGVGMNYMEKALELSGKPPEEEPVIFMKPNSSLIGPGEAIQIPPQSPNVSGEAELAIVIGKTCENVEEADFWDVIAGFTASLDMTAKDIQNQNPRFLQRAKSFNTFCSFGPYLITSDEVPDLASIKVETVLNGSVCHENVIANMMYSPAFIVSFFSKIMTLQPGDTILTGTPGSAIIREGDMIECRITGFPHLTNPVKKRK